MKEAIDIEQAWGAKTVELVEIGAKVTRHASYVKFPLAIVAVTRRLFAAILERIENFALPPPVVDKAET